MEAQNSARRSVNSNVWTGILLLIVGGGLLLRQAGYPLPDWLFTWQMLLIMIGLIIGARNRFRDFSWMVMVIVGFVFLSDLIWPEFGVRKYALPIIIIWVGIALIFAPKRMCRGRHHRFRRNLPPADEMTPQAAVTQPNMETAGESALDIVSIFGGIKKNVLSKQFTGGEVVCVFGGAEINLTNADFHSPIIIDIVNVFGGTKLTIPSNWEIRSEVTTIFGGVDDKRHQPANLMAERTIILKGTLMFGGVEINSF